MNNQNIKRLEALINVGLLAEEHHNAKLETKHAKHLYHIAWGRYETGDENFGDFDNHFYVYPEERIGRGHPDFDGAKMATQKEYDEYKNCKRQENNIAKRLERAIRNLQK